MTRRPLPADDITDVEGVPTMTVAAAIRACRPRVMPDRLRDAVHQAQRRQLLSAEDATRLLDDLVGADHAAPGGAPA